VQLVHLTDPHLTSLAGRPPLAVKRLMSWASWQSHRRVRHLRARLDALMAGVTATEPELWALTGDLCQIGTPPEIDQARDWLDRHFPPGQTLLVPGNHDVFGADSATAVCAQWRDWLHIDGDDRWPVVREHGDIALIGLNSAIVTPAGRATGQLGSAQRERLAAALTEQRARCRVVLIHHPPVPGSCIARKRLVDDDETTAVLAKHGAELVLHGHLHHNRRHSIAGPDGEIPVFCTASASAGGRLGAAAARRFRIQAVDGGFEIGMELLALDASNRVHAIERQRWAARGSGR